MFFNTRTLPVAPLKLASYPAGSRFGRQTTTLRPYFNKFLEIRQLDSSGRSIGTPLKVGTDNVFSLLSTQMGQLLAPTAQVSRQFGALPDAVDATATVLVVVYKDRTSEGDPRQIALVFKGRAMHAEREASAASLLANYPASESEARSVLDKLRQIRERGGAVEQLLNSTGVSTAQQWKTAAAEQKAMADFLTVQSKEVE